MGGRKVFINLIEKQDLKVVLVKAKDIFDFLFESLAYCKPKLTVWDHDECM